MADSNHDITLLYLSPDDIGKTESRKMIPAGSRLILGFISPDIDPDMIAAQLKQICSGIPLILTSTAGELCNRDGEKLLPLYHPARENRQTIVLQCFSPEIVSAVDIHTIDLQQPELEPEKKVELISKEFERFAPAFPLDCRNCVAYTLIDGLSNTENFFMEAVYNSGKLPCLIIGGSSGGKMDFRDTWLYNGNQVVRNKAVMVLIRFTDAIRFGVFKSQNFELTSWSFTVAQADPAGRYIKTIIRKDTGEITDAISELCGHFNCREEDLEKNLQHFSFAIVINGDIYVRSISAIDFKKREIHFYCDISFGDELILVRHTDFISSIKKDYDSFKQGKNGTALGGLFNDCILRRLINQDKLADVKIFDDIPIAGFSTFGELLGVNINQTLTALMFYRVSEGVTFYDEYVNNYIQKYAAFKEFFLRRTISQMRQIMNIKDRAWENSRKNIEQLSQFISESSRKATENENLLQEIDGNFSELTKNIETSSREGTEIGRELEKLGNNAQTIEKILHDIVEVAEQTNLLGFNASIEAARAGSAGRGFAVIAHEVKKLADQTNTSVRESRESVSSLINSMEHLQQQLKTIIVAQGNSRKTEQSLNKNITTLADNSQIIEKRIIDNADKIKTVTENLNKMLSTVRAL
jgi:hypothetical protein